MKEKLKNLIAKLKEKLIPKLKTFIKKRWKLLLIVAGGVAIAIILNALRYTPVGLQLYARVMPSQLITLYTDYGDFTISNGKQSAVFVNGKKVSGDLPVCKIMLDMNKEWEEWQTYMCKIYLCPLRGKQTYEVVQNTSEWCETLLRGEGYEYDLSSAEGGTFTVDAHWKIKVEDDTESFQSIVLSHTNRLFGKILAVYINGSSDGYTAQIKNGDYHFTSKKPQSYNIMMWLAGENVELENYTVDAEGIVVKEKSYWTAVMLRGKAKVETFDISKSRGFIYMFGDGYRFL